uniref:EB domain-containing protein n=1 Tax=Bactrocera latifrons TaxID=174628 RepID=A0A0K8UVY4_BACLA
MNVRKIQRSYQPLLSLQINTVAAAVHTTAASPVADAFVIVVVVVAIAANVAVLADYRTVYVILRLGPDSLSKGNRKRHTQHYNSNYLIILITTTKRKTKTYTIKYNARRHCYEPLDDQNNRNAIIKCDKKNILEKYKCVVCKINKNIINSTKALTRNKENTDFKDTRLSEMASNVHKMEMTLNSLMPVERHDTDVDRGMYVSGNYNHNVTTKSNTKSGAFLTLPFLTVFWLSICGFATSFFNIQAFAAKMLRLQESLVLCGITCNNNNQHLGKPSGGSPLVPSLMPQLPARKPLPPRLPRTAAAAAPPTLVGSDLCASSSTSMICAMQTRLSFTISYLFYAMFILFLLPTVHSDDGDNFFLVNTFSMSPETTTPQFDYASRGQKKFGDKCENTLECGFPGSICDAKKKSCQCTEDLPVTNHIDKCGKEAAVNESCFFNEQCEVKHYQTECRDGRCACRYEMMPFWGKDGTVECKGRGDKRGPETYIDPAMIGVLVGMALMFIIICVVLRLFSQARWRENRTIFNTPNPRLMNVSLLRDGKLLHGQERRGSRMSVRAPSRQPSMASLRPHSPNPSLGKTGSHSGSASASNASATSIRSTRSNSVAPGNVANVGQLERKGSQYHNQHQHQHPHHQQQHQQQMPLITNITANPAAESVAVEIIVPEK